MKIFQSRPRKTKDKKKVLTSSSAYICERLRANRVVVKKVVDALPSAPSAPRVARRAAYSPFPR